MSPVTAARPQRILTVFRFLFTFTDSYRFRSIRYGPSNVTGDVASFLDDQKP